MKKYVLFLLVVCSLPAIAQDNLQQDQSDHTLHNEIKKLEVNYSKLAELNSNLKSKIGDLEDSLKSQKSVINSLQSRLKADVSAVKQGLDKLNDENRKLRKTITKDAEKLYGFINLHEAKIDSLEKLTKQNSLTIGKTAKELGIRIQETGDSSEKKYAALGSSLSQNKVYGILAVLAVALFTIIGFVFLRKRAGTDKTQLVLQIQDTKKQLAEEGVKLDNKLVEVLETQLKLMSEERVSASPAQGEVDHSLALKVADEIVRIEKNLGQMDEGTKGLKQLGKAVDRIKDNFAANGYEMVDLLGKSFDDGMKLVANFRPDDSLKPDERIITRVIKPQVNYKGQMIQSAQVEVSQGEL